MNEQLFIVAGQVMAINLSEALREILDQIPLPDSVIVSDDVLFANVSAPRHLVRLGDKRAAIEYALDIFWVDYFRAGHIGKISYQLQENGVMITFACS